MEKLLEKYGINLDFNQKEKFENFLKIFLEKNEQINLSSIRDVDGIIEKHFIDSLILTKYLKLNGKIADIGTGGGFPGLPLAIYDKNNECDFFLIDSVGKKLKAINEFSNELDLKNVTTIHSRFEDIGQEKDHREKYDFVLSRATAFFPVLLEFAIPLLKIGGIFIAYKLDNDEELEFGKKALKEFNSEIFDIKKYELGGLNRNLVFIKKLKNTDKRYPRKTGIPLKNPIS